MTDIHNLRNERPVFDKIPHDERVRRWRLILGQQVDAPQNLNDFDQQIDRCLSALYDTDVTNLKIGNLKRNKGKGGSGSSSPNVSRWLGDIREYFPSSVAYLCRL